jgi:hypothetical protein
MSEEAKNFTKKKQLENLRLAASSSADALSQTVLASRGIALVLTLLTNILISCSRILPKWRLTILLRRKIWTALWLFAFAFFGLFLFRFRFQLHTGNSAQ